MEQRLEMVGWVGEGESIAEVARRCGVSRKTVYKWLERYEAAGEVGLEERSRAPQSQPNRMSEEVAEAILAERRQHPSFGPRKLKPRLESRVPDVSWPALSTIGELLRREGLSHPRRRRRHTPPRSEPLAHATAPNHVWTADFKGHFLCGDGTRCDPLTISDAFSRYLLRCRAVPKTDGATVRAIFEAAFREHGLPVAIRTDNGPPFASVAPGGLSRLSMWWIRLGIEPERIEPGHPEQNGRHERMHLTLKRATAQPPSANLRRQQETFARFQQEYNYERPHEALGYLTPGAVYMGSRRGYPSREPELVYPGGVQMRRVSQQGSLKWKGERTFLSEVLARETVGLLEVDDELFEVYYGPMLLGWFDADEHVFKEHRTRLKVRRSSSVADTPSKRRSAAEGVSAPDELRSGLIDQEPVR